MTLVSCVMTVLDGEKHIAQAIDSVVAQTHREWELVIVDDGSTDGTAAILEEYRTRHPDRIAVLRHPGGINAGKSMSRNLGVESSKGAIIALLDADDVWLPQKLAQQIAVFDARPDVDLVYGPVIYHYGWTGRPGDAALDSVSRLGLPADRAIDPPVALARMLAADSGGQECLYPYPSATAFRRALFERAGRFEPDFPRLYDDVIFFAKALSLGRCWAISEALALYRLNPGEQLSFSYTLAEREGKGEAPAAERLYQDRLAAFLDLHGISDGRLRRALMRNRLRHRLPLASRVVEAAASLSRALRGYRRKLRRKAAGG